MGIGIDFGYFDRAFLEPWRVVIVSIQAGGDHATAGIILAIILVVLWAFMFWMLKLIIWNVVFPRIRLIDQYGNRIKTARVYLRAKPASVDIAGGLKGTKKEYYWCKFRLFPIITFQKVCIDKEKFRTRRMPWHIDVFTDAMNLGWDNKERCFIVDEGELTNVVDEKQPYIDIAIEDVKTIGDDVIHGVRGDFGLIKRKFKLGLSVKQLENHNIRKEDNEDN
jgi:hypothetical protein